MTLLLWVTLLQVESCIKSLFQSSNIVQPSPAQCRPYLPKPRRTFTFAALISSWSGCSNTVDSQTLAVIQKLSSTHPFWSRNKFKKHAVDIPTRLHSPCVVSRMERLPICKELSPSPIILTRDRCTTASNEAKGFVPAICFIHLLVGKSFSLPSWLFRTSLCFVSNKYGVTKKRRAFVFHVAGRDAWRRSDCYPHIAKRVPVSAPLLITKSALEKQQNDKTTRPNK